LSELPATTADCPMSILAYAPDDLTVVVTADTTLAALQEHLRRRNQWLPVDPWNPGEVTVGQIIDHNLSGPRRYGYGTIREHVLSLAADLADGRRIKAGANVVKNAAGYDLCRLFVGAHGELAAVREVCFKVQPRPEAEQMSCASFPAVEAASQFVDAVDTSCLTPVVLDTHNSGGDGRSGEWVVVIGFAGRREEVAWQRAEAQRWASLAECDLSHDAQFWAQAGEAPVRKVSVSPSLVGDTIRRLELQAVPLLARAGNGIIYYHGGPEAPASEVPLDLMQRLKYEFDPENKFASRA
jgi:glycolate oxidase FAD binding subunit